MDFISPSELFAERQIIIMKKEITVKQEHEVLSLINDIAFACVPAWYDAARRNLKMSIVCPKERKGHEPMPLIVWVCGGAFRLVDRAVWVPEMMYFARRGYVVASVEYRTSPETEFPGALCDVKAAVRYLRAHAEDYCIDPKRVAIMGESAGGALASLVGTTGGCEEFEQGDFLEYSSKVDAVVDYYGLVDIENVNLAGAGTHDVPPFTCEDWIGLNYTKEMARKASAIHYVDENTPPFLILQGEEDICVLPEQSERMYQKLTENNVCTEYYILKGEGHGAPAFYQDCIKDIVLRFLTKILDDQVL